MSFTTLTGLSRVSFSVHPASYAGWAMDDLHATTVPEPASWLQLALGLGAGILRSRRRSSQG